MPVHPFKPPHDAKVVQRPDGGRMFSHADGRKWEVNRDGHLTHFSGPGRDARFSDNGRLVQAHVVRPDRSEMTVRNRAYGQRYEVVRPDHARVVGYGPRRGFVERPVPSRPGYVSRTYVVGKRSYTHVYRTATYRNVVYYNYVPAYSYQPGYYQWLLDSWTPPPAFNWGADPGAFGPYFAPEPTYPDASLWLTDDLLAEDLKDASENRPDAADSSPAPPRPTDTAGGAPPVAPSATPSVTLEMKKALAEEVRQEIEAEQAAAAEPASSTSGSPRADNQPPPALDPKIRTFVVSQDIELEGSGPACPLTSGDIIVRTSDTPVEQTKVPVTVLSSKRGDCPASSTTGLVEIAELQEMYNDFRERIDSGLKTLAEKQGTGGLPAGPAASPREVPAGTAVPDLYAESELTRQQQGATQTAAELQQEADAGNLLGAETSDE
jgi:hypothetical protein